MFASLLAQTVKKESATMQEYGFDPWVRKIPWRREWQPTLLFLPGKFHGQRSLVGSSPWSRQESGMTERLTLHPVCLLLKERTAANKTTEDNHKPQAQMF